MTDGSAPDVRDDPSAGDPPYEIDINRWTEFLTGADEAAKLGLAMTSAQLVGASMFDSWLRARARLAPTDAPVASQRAHPLGSGVKARARHKAADHRAPFTDCPESMCARYLALANPQLDADKVQNALDILEQELRRTITTPDTNPPGREGMAFQSFTEWMAADGVRIAERRLRTALAAVAPTSSDYRPMLDGRAIHAAWCDGMLAQGRVVAPERMNWGTLSEEDRQLDHGIAADIALIANQPDMHAALIALERRVAEKSLPAYHPQSAALFMAGFLEGRRDRSGDIE